MYCANHYVYGAKSEESQCDNDVAYYFNTLISLVVFVDVPNNVFTNSRFDHSRYAGM